MMNSQKEVENVSFKVYLKNSNNGTENDEVKRFVVESDAATSITHLRVKSLFTYQDTVQKRARRLHQGPVQIRQKESDGGPETKAVGIICKVRNTQTTC